MTRDHSSTSSNLLRAALLDGDAGAMVFQAWQTAAELDDLPAHLHALLPLLCRNLEALGVDHPWLPRLKGYYRRTWYANQVVLRALAEVMDRLATTGHPLLITGAAALAHTLYPEVALRPIYTPEIVVPSDAADEAMGVLHTLGWRAEPASPHLSSPAFRAWVAGQRFVNDQGQALWLGWHVVPSLPCADLDAACWAAATELTLDGRPVRTLCPADHLLRTCLAAPEAGLIALADAALLIRRGEIDWQRLTEMAGHFRAGRPVLRVLEMLAEVVGLAAPPEVLAALRRLPAFYAEKRIPIGLAGLAQPAARQQRFWLLLARYQRTAACAGRAADPRSFVAYLQHTRHLDSPWRLPQLVMRRMVGQ